MTAVYRLRLTRTVRQTADFEILAENAEIAEAKVRSRLPYVREWLGQVTGEAETEFIQEVIPPATTAERA